MGQRAGTGVGSQATRCDWETVPSIETKEFEKILITFLPML